MKIESKSRAGEVVMFNSYNSWYNGVVSSLRAAGYRLLETRPRPRYRSAVSRVVLTSNIQDALRVIVVVPTCYSSCKKNNWHDEIIFVKKK